MRFGTYTAKHLRFQPGACWARYRLVQPKLNDGRRSAKWTNMTAGQDAGHACKHRVHSCHLRHVLGVSLRMRRKHKFQVNGLRGQMAPPTRLPDGGKHQNMQLQTWRQTNSIHAKGIKVCKYLSPLFNRRYPEFLGLFGSLDCSLTNSVESRCQEISKKSALPFNCMNANNQVNLPS